MARRAVAHVPAAADAFADRWVCLGGADRAGFAAVLALRIEATATGIRRLAGESEPVFARLVADGTVAEIERSSRWALAHANEIDAALL